MNFRKPERRLTTVRRSDNEKRALADMPIDSADLAALANRVSYEAYAKHKLNPRAFGLDPISSVSDDPTFCDGHAGFTPRDMPRIQGLLRRGVLSGLIGKQGWPDEPRTLWTIDDSGWIFEGRITHPGRAIYHGYPILAGDAIAVKVISRFQHWLYGTSNIELYACDKMTIDAGTAILTATLERYKP